MQGGGRYNPYPSNQPVPTRGQPLQVPPANVATNAYVNAPGGYDCYNGFYAPGINRASYPAYPVNYEDEVYSGQSPAYMLPNNNESMVSTNSLLGPPGSPRTWDVFSSSGRGQTGLYPDHNPSSSVSHPSGTFTGNNIPYPSNPNDIPSSLSSSHNISTSMTSLDRVLPNPARGRSQQPALVMAGTNSLDGLAMSNVGYRSSVPWVGSDGMSGSSQSSDRLMSVSYGSTVDRNGGSGESAATTEDAPFAYGPMPHGSAGAPMTVASALADPGSSDTTQRSDDVAAGRRTRALSHETTPAPESTTMAEAYGYGSDVVLSRRSARGSISSGTLSNGQEYTRLRPLPTPTPELYRRSQQEPTEYQSQIPHRTSIASLSGSVRY